jgi:hypothetical protein
MVRRHTGGLYAASVSIRSGRGSMTHDRVMRFVPLFISREQASRFALDQAKAWLAETVPSLAPLTHPQESIAWPRKN